MKWYEYVFVTACMSVIILVPSSRYADKGDDDSELLRNLDSISVLIGHYQTVDKERFQHEIDSLNSAIEIKTKNIEEIRKAYEAKIDHIRDMPNADADSLFSANLYWISKDSSYRE